VTFDLWGREVLLEGCCPCLDPIPESSATTTAESDVDLLYTLAPGAHLGWAIEDLNAELADLVGRPVDLVSPRALNPRIRDEVLAEAQPFYPAGLD